MPMNPKTKSALKYTGVGVLGFAAGALVDRFAIGPKIMFSNANPAAGETISISVSGFLPNSKIYSVTYGNTPTINNAGVTDLLGRLTFSLNVNYAAGQYPLVAFDDRGAAAVGVINVGAITSTCVPSNANGQSAIDQGRVAPNGYGYDWGITPQSYGP
jgi:hypothetical protein